MARRVRNNPPDWMGELDPNKRYTCSEDPITSMRDTSSELALHFKPVGLWYGCGLSWIRWLEIEMPSWLEDFRYVYEVVPDTHDVLFLRTVADVQEFDRHFGTNQYPGFGSTHTDVVQWKDVGSYYAGIEICPYQRSLRLGTIGWYSAWDVASGCIWQPVGTQLRLVASI